MHVYYCKKCKVDSMTPVCDHCGMQIAALSQNERFKWRFTRTPLSDSQTVLGAFKLLAVTMTLLVALLFLGELIFASDKQSALTMFTNSGILPWALVVFGAGAALILVFLGLQGAEETHYVVDSRGAHLQTWIEPGYIKCLARFLPYEPYNVTRDAEGHPRMLVNETHLLWPDVCRYEVNKRVGRIDLYRPSGFRFMSLYPEREEMGELLAYIQPRMKHLAAGNRR